VVSENTDMAMLPRSVTKSLTNALVSMKWKI
jgi:hypothetical protein